MAVWGEQFSSGDQGNSRKVFSRSGYSSCPSCGGKKSRQWNTLQDAVITATATEQLYLHVATVNGALASNMTRLEIVTTTKPNIGGRRNPSNRSSSANRYIDSKVYANLW